MGMRVRRLVTAIGPVLAVMAGFVADGAKRWL